ncbi:DUF397 domain-containing protein [Streptomyces tateyamensis]|uniref:DUF397 domain-containing protein n=1 Tax=Streptomyces tateyamensis TaxID=565073 RepID=A0A2V4N8A7_9ACTN|nr:DUF397 domain-containing protein [Streptomyces tateyamensis]PYC77748.1 DUF397 domain-containing protein [Streptomyces tateyamensis]
MRQLHWLKPSVCDEGNNCPEIAITADAVYLRSTLHPDAAPTELTHQEWRDLLDGIAKGEFTL